MESDKILNFARQSGYATIEYLGKYKEYDLYKPFYEDPHIATGLPAYIIVKDENPKFARAKQVWTFKNIEFSRIIQYNNYVKQLLRRD